MYNKCSVLKIVMKCNVKLTYTMINTALRSRFLMKKDNISSHPRVSVGTAKDTEPLRGKVINL